MSCYCFVNRFSIFFSSEFMCAQQQIEEREAVETCGEKKDIGVSPCSANSIVRERCTQEHNSFSTPDKANPIVPPNAMDPSSAAMRTLRFSSQVCLTP